MAVATNASAMPPETAAMPPEPLGDPLEGVDDPDDGAEQPDERCGRADRGQAPESLLHVGQGHQRRAVEGAFDQLHPRVELFADLIP